MTKTQLLETPEKFDRAGLVSTLEIRRIGRLLLDVGSSAASFLIAIMLISGTTAFLDPWGVLADVLAFSATCAAVYLAVGLPLRSWRFVSIQDMLVLLPAIGFACIGFIALSLVTRPLADIPASVPLIACFVMITMLGGMRVAYRCLMEGRLPFRVGGVTPTEPQRILAYGANVETDAFFRSLQSENARSFEVVGIIDDEPANRDRCIRGVKVVGSSGDLMQTVRRFAESSIKIPSLVVPASSLPRQKLREIVDTAAAAGLRAVRLPHRWDLLREPDAGLELQPIDLADSGKVLVIGGAGYIGSILVEKLLDIGLEVTVLDGMHFGEQALARVAGHPALKVIREDFRHIEAITRAMNGVGSVVHLGGLVGDPACATDPELTIDINVTATKLVGEIAKAQGVRRFVFASSCSVYGACDEIVDEESRLNPQSLYARTKVASEVVLRSLNDPTFAVTCLRFATVYGVSERTRFDLVVNLLCAKAVHDRVITVFGEDQWRPFVHVDDVARAIVMMLHAPVEIVANEAFNVGSDEQNFTLGEVARLIRSQVTDAEILSDPNCPDKRNYRVSFRKIRHVGFRPSWSIERGISQVVASVRSNEVGHYSLPEYSNFLFMKEHGTKCLSSFNLTGWENELMRIDRVGSGSTMSPVTAA